MTISLRTSILPYGHLSSKYQNRLRVLHVTQTKIAPAKFHALHLNNSA